MNDKTFDAVGQLLNLFELHPAYFASKTRPALRELADLYDVERSIRQRGGDREIADMIERMTVHERHYVALFGVGYGVNESLRDCAYAAVQSLIATKQSNNGPTDRFEMPPVRSAEDEAATVNAEAHNCKTCGRLTLETGYCRACELQSRREAR